MTTVQQVHFTNTAPSAIWTRGQDNPARQPFQQELSYDGNTLPTWPTVPAGKCLVIEYVSGYVNVPTGDLLYELALQTQAGTQGAAHRLPATLMASGLDYTPLPGGKIDRYRICHMLRVYASSGTQVTFVAGGCLSWDLTISGHLVDVP